MFNTMGMAGGGIVAFDNGGDVEDPMGLGQMPPSAGYKSTIGSFGDLLGALGTETEFQKAARFKRRGVEYTPPEGYNAQGLPIKKETKAQTADKPADKQTKAEPSKGVSTTSTKEAPSRETPATKEPELTGREAYLAQTQALMEKQGFKSGASADEQAYADLIAKQQAGLGDATSAKERANMAKAFLKMGANPRGFLAGAIEGGESYLTGAGEIAAGREAREMALAEARSKYSAAQRARAAGDIATSDKLFQEAAKLENQLKIAQGNNATTLAAAATSAAASKIPYQMQREEKEAIRAELRTKLGREPTTTEVIAAYSTASNKTADTTVQGQIEKAFAAQTGLIDLKLQNPDLSPEDRKKLEDQKVQIYQAIVKRLNAGQQTAGAGGGAKGQVDTKNPLLGG
jgi:hypothetical protein